MKSGCGIAWGIDVSFCSRRVEEEGFEEIQHCQGRGGRKQTSCDLHDYESVCVCVSVCLSVYLSSCVCTFREANQNSLCLGQMTSHCFYGNQERARNTLQEWQVPQLPYVCRHVWHLYLSHTSGPLFLFLPCEERWGGGFEICLILQDTSSWSTRCVSHQMPDW